MLKCSVSKDFLDLFYQDYSCDIDLVNAKLHLHTLQIENNEFAYNRLIEKLTNILVHYCLSRRHISEMQKDGRIYELWKQAARKFKTADDKSGEAGELLLYCLLESHLKAPKLLSKLEIKTSSEDYVKGSDGIHLLQIDERTFQLIFGESKLYPSLTNSITEAFKSIKDFIDRPKNNINTELGLLSSELVKEAYTPELYELIKSVVFPKTNREDAIECDKSFGIFAGFEINFSEDEKRLKNSDFRKVIRKRIKGEVEGKKDHIRKKIEEYSLQGYTFYVYAVPFTTIVERRKKIIEDLVTV